MAAYDSTLAFSPVSFDYNFSLAENPSTYVSPMKRHYPTDQEYSSSDESWEEYNLTSKKFASEEIVSSHLQQLRLNTPPHFSHSSTPPPYHHISVTTPPCNSFASLTNEPNKDSCSRLDLWLETNTDEDINEDIWTRQSVIEREVPSVSCADISSTLPQENRPCRQEDIILMEENSDEESSDDDSSRIQVWIAPEMEHVLKNKRLLDHSSLPEKILDTIRNKPCQALVPYVKTEASLVHSVWKNRNEKVASDEGKVKDNSKLSEEEESNGCVSKDYPLTTYLSVNTFVDSDSETEDMEL